MSYDQLTHVRVGLRHRGASVKLRLRWDRSPRTCESICKSLPFEQDLWHAKYAHNEIYMLVAAWAADPPREWACAYPGIGDLMYIPHPPGLLPKHFKSDEHVIDLAYFYERGNCLYGPGGPAIGNIFATAASIDDCERFAEDCHAAWRQGIEGETMYIESAS